MSTVQDAIKHWSHVEPLLRMPANEAEYDTLVARLDDVLDAGGHDEGHPLAALAARMGDLIEAYDEQHRPVPNVTGVSVLRYLMDEHALTQGDLPEIGTQSVVSEVLSGRRFLNVRHVAALARRFNLPAGVFIDAEDYSARTVKRSKGPRSKHMQKLQEQKAIKRGRRRRPRSNAVASRHLKLA